MRFRDKRCYRWTNCTNGSQSDFKEHQWFIASKMDIIKTNTLSFRFPPFLKHFEYDIFFRFWAPPAGREGSFENKGHRFFSLKLHKYFLRGSVERLIIHVQCRCRNQFGVNYIKKEERRLKFVPGFIFTLGNNKRHSFLYANTPQLKLIRIYHIDFEVRAKKWRLD